MPSVHHRSRKQDQNPASQFRPNFQSVYDGRQCIGTIIPRNKEGFEAFAADDSSLGLFDTDMAAAAAIMRNVP